MSQNSRSSLGLAVRHPSCAGDVKSDLCRVARETGGFNEAADRRPRKDHASQLPVTAADRSMIASGPRDWSARISRRLSTLTQNPFSVK